MEFSGNLIWRVAAEVHCQNGQSGLQKSDARDPYDVCDTVVRYTGLVWRVAGETDSENEDDSEYEDEEDYVPPGHASVTW